MEQGGSNAQGRGGPAEWHVRIEVIACEDVGRRKRRLAELEGEVLKQARS